MAGIFPLADAVHGTVTSSLSNDIACYSVDYTLGKSDSDCNRTMQLTLGNQAMTAKTAAAAKAPIEALLLEIVAKHFCLETLETRNSDGLDFYDVAVWSIRAALEAAFAAGQATTR